MKARDARGWIVGVLLAALAVGVMWWPQAARADWRSLTGPLPTFVNRVDYQISPDSQTVVFTADADTDDVTELYAVPVTGTLPIKLNPPLVEGGQVSDFIFTPDGKSVVYRADQEVDNRLELFRVPVAGGTAEKLSGSLVAGGNVRGYQIDSKNGRLVYIADAQINEQFELWSVPLTGGEPTNLSHLATAGRQVGDTFKFDPLSDRVVFNSNDNSSHDAHLYDVYSVPVTGGTPVQLNPPIVNAGGGDSGIYGEFDVVPGQSIVVFVAREKDTGMPGMPQSPRGTLYQVPTDGSAAAQALSFHMNADQRINNFRVSPAGTDVIYEVAKDDLSPPKAQFSTQGSLYRNAVGGGGAANVTETADPLFGTDNFQLLTDGSRVVYSFQNSESTSLRLEAATMLGVRTPLYDPGATGPKLSFFRLSPDSKRVMYQTQDEQGNTDGLFLVSPTGGNAESYGRATFQAFMPDSSRILYTRVVSDTFFTDLFSQQVGTGGELNLSKLDPLGSVFDTQVSADGKWIVFETQVDGHPELRVSDGEKAQPPTPTPTVTLTPTATPTGTLTPQATATPTATPTLRPGETPDPFEEHLPALKNEK